MSVQSGASLYESVTKVTSIEKHKFVLLGDANTGKTSIITRFMYNTFDPSYQSTIGIDFVSKTCYYGERAIRVQLWDTAGQERFRSLIPSYIRDSTVAILVYDITNRSSFDNINKWYSHVKEQKDDIITLLVGNKVDLQNERCILTEEGERKAAEFHSFLIETSAKDGLNVDTIFQKVLSMIPVEPSKEFHRYYATVDIRITADEPVANSTVCLCLTVFNKHSIKPY